MPAEFGFRGAVEKHTNKMNKEKCNKNKTEMKKKVRTSFQTNSNTIFFGTYAVLLYMLRSKVTKQGTK